MAYVATICILIDVEEEAEAMGRSIRGYATADEAL